MDVTIGSPGSWGSVLLDHQISGGTPRGFSPCTNAQTIPYPVLQYVYAGIFPAIGLLWEPQLVFLPPHFTYLICHPRVFFSPLDSLLPPSTTTYCGQQRGLWSTKVLTSLP